MTVQNSQTSTALVQSGTANDEQSTNGSNNGTTGEPSGSESKNKRYQKKKKRSQNKKNRNKKKQGPVFKGTISEMNGHVFQCQSERPSGNQFLRSVQELKSYVSIKLSKYPHDIIYILKHMEECIISKPPPPDKNADKTDTRIWEKEVDKFVDRRDYYKQNKSSLYAIIWAQCSLPMQAQLKSLVEYRNIHRSDDCLSLLQSIRAISMKFESHDYMYKAMYVATKKFYNYKQGQYETEAEYMANFKDLSDAIIYYGGSLGEDPVLVRQELITLGFDMESYEKLSTATRQIMNLNLEPGSSDYKKAAYIAREKFFAMAFLMSSDPRRYKNLLVELDNDHSKGTGNYPNTLTASYSLLVNYRSQSFQGNTHTSEGDDNNDGSEDDVAFLQSKRFVPTCHICGKEGHIAPRCPEKGKSNNTEAATPSTPVHNATQMLMNAAEDTQSAGLDFSFGHNLANQSNYYMNFVYSSCFTILANSIFQPITTSQQIVLRNGGHVDPHWILLDTQSTVNLFSNRNLIQNIHKTKGYPLRCYCNGGFQDSILQGTLDGYGEVWYNPRSLANILSMALVSDSFRVTFDTAKEQAIFVWRTNGTFVKFIRSPNGLYYHDVRWGDNQPMGPEPKIYGTTLVQTVEDNKKIFTPNDIKRADLAKRVYEMVGRPSSRDFYNMIKFNMIQNCPVTISDVKIAKHIYGADVYAIRGKTVRSAPKRVVTETMIPIPPSILTHYKKITLCIDIFYVDKITFLTTISRKILFMTVENITNRKLPTIYNSIKKVIHIYRARGFRVHFVLADNEFKGLRADILELKIYLNCAAANEHVPEIERAIRVIKERVRAAISSLPFRALPQRIKKELVYYLVTCLNMFPRRGGVSNHLSPRTLIYGTPLDFLIQCRVPFGAYCEIHDEKSPTNNMVSRTTPAIAIGPTGNLQGTYKFYSLRSKKVVVRRKWSELPMPPTVIKLVEDIARKELKIKANAVLPEMFTFYDRHRNIITEQDIIYMNDDHPFAPPIDDPSVAVDEGASHTSNSIQSTPTTSSLDPDMSLATNDHDDNASLSDNDNSMISYDSDSILSSDEGASDIDDNSNKEKRVRIKIESDSDDNIADENNTNSINHIENDDDDNSSSNESDDNDLDRITAEVEEINILPDTGVNSRYNLRKREHIAHLHVRSPSDYTNRYGYAAHVMLVQVSAKKGLQMFGERAALAIIKEFKQLHDKAVFRPIHSKTIPFEERRKALRAITLVQEKRCGKIKGRTVADGSSQRDYINPEDAASPTVSLEALMITAAIDATEQRDVATADISGAFLQADIDELVLVMFEGVMVDLLIKTDPMYANFVHVNKTGKKTLYVKLTKAMYGCMKAARLFYENLSSFLVELGFKINPYDLCTANKIIHGKQCTIVWHVDDLKISHVESSVVTEVLSQLESKYGEMSITRGKKHTYVGINFEFKANGTVDVEMEDYMKECIEEFPEEITKASTSPATQFLFDVNDDCDPLSPDNMEIFHKIVAKLLFACKRARPDIQTVVAFLTTRVSKSNDDDWKKLKRCLQYLHGTIDLKLTLSAENMTIIKWWVDASYAVHNDMKSHTGAALSLGRGIIYGKSAKQKLNTKSSTEAEVVGVSDVSSQIFWTLYFLLEQGYDVKENRLYQDNKSSILLENNGRLSSSQRTRHMNIRYFFIKDRVDKEEVNIVYCPTGHMVGDFFTKPLQGKQFIGFRNKILGIDVNPDFDSGAC